jgi:hypothetical protein
MIVQRVVITNKDGKEVQGCDTWLDNGMNVEKWHKHCVSALNWGIKTQEKFYPGGNTTVGVLDTERVK